MKMEVPACSFTSIENKKSIKHSGNDLVKLSDQSSNYVYLNPTVKVDLNCVMRMEIASTNWKCGGIVSRITSVK